MMEKTLIVCFAPDLKKDVELYVSTIRRASLERDFSKLEDGDTAIIYTHGQYDPDLLRANNLILLDDEFRPALDVAKRLFKNYAMPKKLQGVKVVIHACFSAGTRHQVETGDHSFLDTFAGQLHSSMKGLMRSPFKVTGFVGQAKVGNAGYYLDDSKNHKGRVSSRSRNPHDGNDWSVSFVADEETPEATDIVEGSRVQENKHRISFSS